MRSLRSIQAALVLAALVWVLARADAHPSLSTDEWNGLKREAARAAQAGQEDELARIVEALARDDSKRAVELITGIVAQVPDAVVYEAACRGLAAMRADDALDVLEGKLARGGGAGAKLLVIDAFALRDDERTGAALAAALEDRRDEVIRAAIAAVRRRRLLAGVDGLIATMADLERERQTSGLMMTLVREALYELTGASFASSGDWRNFWEPRRAGFTRPETGGAGPPRHGATGERGGAPPPTFFGSEIASNRVVFVIDVSQSMEHADPAPPGGAADGGSRVRIERAKQQLSQCVAALTPDVQFTIHAYSGMLFRGPNGESQFPPGTPLDGPLPPRLGEFEWLKVFSPTLVAATPRARADAQAFVAALQPNGSTFTLNALRSAFTVEGADTIVLLSDGMPTEVDRRTMASLDTAQILGEVGSLNRTRRLRIDTFGFGGAGGGRGHGPGGGGPGGGGGGGDAGLGQFMQDLAAQNSGRYTEIQ